MKVLVTGATGYIGGRLVPELLAQGHRIRVLTRDPGRLAGRPWQDQVEAVQGDALKPETLSPALDGVQAAYYLIHSMQGSEAFHQRDLEAAHNFGQAAQDGGTGRILYLGGLGDPEADLSEHLRSRHATGRALGEHGVPVTEFRAGIVVGAGSVSFEMIRNLVERLPVMIAPRWVSTLIQPIAIHDVLAYLVQALKAEPSVNRIVEIGGADILTYGDMLLRYADVRGLRRVILPVPVLTPRLSSYWVHWVTPVPAAIARPLIEGLRNEVVVQDRRAAEIFPDIHPMGYREAVERALESLTANDVSTAWTDALASSQRDRPPVTLTFQEGMFIERRRRAVRSSAPQTFTAFTSLGGRQGWLYANWLWGLRGLLDRLLGGVGLRRGRRSPSELRPGEALDFWRVEDVEPGRRLLLRAEMRLPGQAWLEFRTEPDENGGASLEQVAYFAPKGLSGLLYWYLLYPIHRLIFSGLIDRLSQLAEGRLPKQR